MNIHFLIVVFAWPLHSAQLRSHILPFSFGFPILCSLMAMVRLFFLIRLIAPCKGIQDSPGFWIPRRGLRIPVFVSGTWILDSKCDLVRFRILELYSGYRSNWLNKQNNNSARASRFFCTFHYRHCANTTGKCLISRDSCLSA